MGGTALDFYSPAFIVLPRMHWRTDREPPLSSRGALADLLRRRPQHDALERRALYRSFVYLTAASEFRWLAIIFQLNYTG